ncbi:hypothetical protein [Bacillus litorisediminis]|uniref:hypothetical protein n=1 Tax=Bacillus litorisediminis TaxID=2922713 RepID=UPI001FAB6A09|nr:hypothetical protein [Bacillus litorisediminis]
MNIGISEFLITKNSTEILEIGINSNEVNFLERKIEFDEKIRVFISSICGVEKYDNVRMQLKNLIEATGFAKVYLFEERRASTLTAEQDYLYGLDDSDVCIFLIDNADGVPEGVLKEYQRAKAHPKKSLYIFCNENQKEPSQIQKEITGARGAKYYITKSFEEFVTIGYQSLMNDIGEIYISYCKGRLLDPDFTISTGSIEEIDAVASESLDKQIFKNIDRTKKLITNEIFSRSNREEENTSDLDTYSAQFLSILFGYKTISEFNTYFLLSSLEVLQSQSLHKVVKERWKAIQYYFMNDLVRAIEYEKMALDIARDLQVPNWLIQDILIDLRNLYIFEGQEKNRYVYSSTAQEELDSEKSTLFYPLLDRYEKALYEEIINQVEKSSMRSPYSVTWGNSINQYGDYISNIYIMAVFNGSLTHLLRTIDRIKDVAFHLCNQYSDWEFRILLLKTAISKGNKKEIKGLTDLFNDVYGKMNAEDSKKIYEFAKSKPIKYQMNIAQLLAFQHLGYFFSEDYYSEVWKEIMKIIDDWIDSEDRIVALGDFIFDAIKDNLFRLDNNLVVTKILMKVFDRGLRRFYDKVLQVVIRIDFDALNEENLTTIINQIEILIEDETARKNCNKLESAIISVRKKNLELSKELNKTVMRVMPEFYNNLYSLETQIESQVESEMQINKFIAKIKDRNETQGKNGKYTGYMDNPYKTIERIIVINKVKISEEMVDSIVSVCKDTLYAKNQTLNAKVQAINLITFLRLVSEEKLYDFKQLINQIKKNEELILSGSEIMLDKTSKSTLHFNFMMMKLVFNSVELEEIVELLSSYTELETFEKLEALKTIVSMFEHGKTDNIDKKIILLILQFALGLSNDKNHDVRYFATTALLHILSENIKGPFIKRILSLMDYDSIFIKNQIMNYSEKLKAIDNEAFSFIKEKALVDNHFVIRQRALTL